MEVMKNAKNALVQAYYFVFNYRNAAHPMYMRLRLFTSVASCKKARNT